MDYKDALDSIGKMVKSFSKDFQHGVPAMLISIINKDTCIIKPVGHKKSERCPLSKISYWKSRNDAGTEVIVKDKTVEVKDDFYDHTVNLEKVIGWCGKNYYPILRFKNGQEVIKAKLFKCHEKSVSLISWNGGKQTVYNGINALAFYDEDQKKIEHDSKIEEFVIVNNETRMFWGGRRKWIKELINIVKYNDQYGRSACTKVLKHTPKAELVRFDCIHELISNWTSEPAPVSEPTPVSEPVSEPAPVSEQPTESTKSVLNKLMAQLESAYRDRLAAEDMASEAQNKINKLKFEIDMFKLKQI